MWLFWLLLVACVSAITGFCYGCYYTREFIYDEGFDYEAEIDEKLKYAEVDKDE